MSRRLYSLFLAALLCLSGAAAEGAEPVAATVNGQAITEASLQERMASAAVINKQTDDGLSTEEKNARDAALREATLNALIEETALLQEADRRGLNAETLREDIEARFNKMVGAVAAYVLSSYPDLSEDALAEQVNSLLNATGASLDAYYATAARASILAALDEQLVAEAVPPTEEALRAAYDALWEKQKQTFDADENAFEAALLQGELVLYRPRDVKLIQKAEFLFEDGAAALIGQTEQSAPDVAGEMRQDQFTKAKARADAATEALAKGETTFPELLQALGGSADVNYYHPTSTRFSQAYAERAAAFERAGEVSSLYEMPNGYALLYYAGDLSACAQVPYEEAAEALRREWTEQRREETLREARAALAAAAEVERSEGTAE